MKGHVSWVVDVAVKAGKLEDFEELMEEMVAGTSTEPLTLAYEWYISEDRGTIHIYEKYASSEAMVSHVRGFLEKWAERFTQCVDVRSFVVYGEPSAEGREILDGFGATYLSPWGGFSRFD
jgi:quinol monooxygenase YgiN